MLTVKQTKAVQTLIPKDRAAISPTALLAIAKAVVVLLKALGVKLPDILDVLEANGLPVPANLKPAK